MNETKYIQWKEPRKWLQLLMCLQVAHIAFSVISSLLTNDGWIAWVSRAITAAVIVCLFQMACAHGNYRKAAIFQVARLGCNLINPLVLSPLFVRLALKGTENLDLLSAVSTVVSLAAMVCAVIADYLEYHAHADIAAQPDPRLSQNWRLLFICTLVLTALSTVVSFAAAPLFEMAVIDTATVIAINKVFRIAATLLELLYLWLLYRLLPLFKNK